MLSSNQPRQMPTHKFVVLGEGGVGKTCICTQFVLNHFVETYDPTGSDDFRKQVFVDSKTCMLEIFDTIGQDEYPALIEHYIQNGDAFLLVFSITSRHSFTKIKTYYQMIQSRKELSVPLILVGNKCDLASTHREVSSQEAEALAQEMGCTVIETSAKVPINIEETFYNLIRLQRKHIEGQNATEVETKVGEVEKKGWRNRLSSFIKSLAKGKTG